jgi:hypothetical protein
MSGFASLRNFNTYVRRLGYLDSWLKLIARSLAAELERQRRPRGQASSKRMVDIGSERGAHSNVRTHVGPILIQ